MTQDWPNPYRNPKPYIPASLSEIYDFLAPMLSGAPTFIDKLGDFPEQNIDSSFHQLTEGFGLVRKKLGEERYFVALDLAARAKALFEADPEDTSGKTDEGCKLLLEIEEIIQAARRHRVKAKLPDHEGEVTGD